MNLDEVLPNPHYRMCHSRIVGAPRTLVWDELHRVTMAALPLGRGLEGVRLLPARLAGRKRQPLAGRTFLDVTPIPVLFSEPPRVVISAGLSQAWRLLGGSIRRIWTRRLCAPGPSLDGPRPGWNFALNRSRQELC